MYSTYIDPHTPQSGAYLNNQLGTLLRYFKQAMQQNKVSKDKKLMDFFLISDYFPHFLCTNRTRYD
jgi:hypothetical protein